jgi:hypothetical protein
MPLTRSNVSAKTVEELERVYHARCRARAEGGWWALSGFSFQAAGYLLRYFEGLSQSRVEPAELAKIERLSDIFQPLEDGTFRIIQVKRTLGQTQVRAALEEAYALTALCGADLLNEIRFQILCRHDPHDMAAADLRSMDPNRGDVDPIIWASMLARFDQISPIIVDDDPLDRLHYILWRAGVRRTQQLIDRAHGLLLQGFIDPSEKAVNQIARKLSDEFYAYRQEWSDAEKPKGRLLHADDFAPEPNRNDDKTLFIERRPHLRDIRLARFHNRAALKQLTAMFHDWWIANASRETIEKIPVFWIGGRSGDGKSLQLLQLLSQRVDENCTPRILLNQIGGTAGVHC